MLLKILGSGTCVPSIKRGSPANYLKIGNTQILVDCGAGTLSQLLKAKPDYKTINMVCISHFHTDHISDLNALIQALNWTPKFNRKTDLVLIGSKGFKAFYNRYLKPISDSPRPNTYKIIVKEINNKINFKDFSIYSFKTKHSKESVAYKFIQDAKSLVISGDTDFDENLSKFAKNSDILVLECAFANRDKETGHLIPKECGQVAKLANTKKLILTHIYPLGSGEERLKETKIVFPKTILARDLMSINF
jgi:ribonuclease BN (tRNA processing enzyme)